MVLSTKWTVALTFLHNGVEPGQTEVELSAYSREPFL